MVSTQTCSSQPRLKILLVEDNAKVRDLIRYALDEVCAAIIECADGADALDAYKVHHPDLVLMDIQMPRLDGLAATKILMAYDPDAKIHLLSDFDEDMLQSTAAAIGASGYTSKVNIDELSSIVSRYAVRKAKPSGPSIGL